MACAALKADAANTPHHWPYQHPAAYIYSLYIARANKWFGVGAVKSATHLTVGAAHTFRIHLPTP